VKTKKRPPNTERSDLKMGSPIKTWVEGNGRKYAAERTQ